MASNPSTTALTSVGSGRGDATGSGEGAEGWAAAALHAAAWLNDGDSDSDGGGDGGDGDSDRDDDDPPPPPAKPPQRLHTRILHASDAPRLLRRRPMVEAVTCEGKPLRPITGTGRRSEARELEWACQLRAWQLARHDGAKVHDSRPGAPPKGSLNVHDLSRRGEGKPPQTSGVDWGAENSPQVRSYPHPSGGRENGKRQHVLNDGLLEAMSAEPQGCREIKPNPMGGDVQYSTVHAQANGGPLHHIFFVREDSPEWTLADSDRDECIDRTNERAVSRTTGKDNTASRSDTSAGSYVNVGNTTLWQDAGSQRELEGGPNGSNSVACLCSATGTPAAPAFLSKLKELTELTGATVADWIEDEREAEENRSEYEKKARESKWSNETILREMGLHSHDMASSKEYKRCYGAPYRCVHVGMYVHVHVCVHVQVTSYAPVHVNLCMSTCTCVCICHSRTPSRHVNWRQEAVRAMCVADARVAGAAARVLARHGRETYDVYGEMWRPVLAAPTCAPAMLFPSPAVQAGLTDDEWACWSMDPEATPALAIGGRPRERRVDFNPTISQPSPLIPDYTCTGHVAGLPSA